MEEFIKKEDGFTAWRAKLNRVYGTLSWLLAGAKERSVLSSENGNVEWKPIEDIRGKASDGNLEDDAVQSLHVDGILNAVSLAVTGASMFLCRIEARSGISASSISVVDSLVFGAGGRTASIKMSAEGLNIGNAVFGTSEVRLPSSMKLGDARISSEGGFLTFSGTKTPLRLNIQNGGADFPQGLSGKELTFPNGKIDGESYTGCAESAKKLEQPAEIFGHPFDGTESISGSIDGCTGLTFTDKAEISFKDSLSPETLSVANGAMKWTGSFIPRILFVEADHYCEWYPSKEFLSAGDIITLDASLLEESYCRASAPARPLAVVASEHSVCIGKMTDASYPCCNRGRVPAKVEGSVVKGDLLVLSSTAGVLRAANAKERNGKAWAVALETSETEGIKLVRIHIL